MRISGKIIDDIGPLQDVNIVVLDSNNEPTTIGTITRTDGIFLLENNAIQPNTTIQLSFVGFRTILAPANALQGGTLEMQIDDVTLEEITIIGTKPKPSPKQSMSWLWWLIPVAGVAYYFNQNQPKRVKI